MNKLPDGYGRDSKSFKKLNPHLFGVVQFHTEIVQPKCAGALDSATPGKQASGSRVVGNRPLLRITLVGFRRRILDDDNYCGGCKGLRDAIARWLGLDDNQKIIEWEYSQVKTNGRQGTAVRIERL